MSEFLTRKLCLPRNLFQYPISQKAKISTFTQHISNRLYKHELQIRRHTDNISNDLFSRLTTNSYNAHRQAINQRFTPTVQPIIENVTLNDKFISYNRFVQELPTPFIFDREITTIEPSSIPPDYFNEIFKAWTKKLPATRNDSQPIKVPHRYKHQPSDPSQWSKAKGFIYCKNINDICSIPKPENWLLHPNQKFNIWTDGSFRQDERYNLGCSFVITDTNNSHEIGYLATTIERSPTPSSTRAELGAILLALYTLPTTADLNLHIDSETAMKQIHYIINCSQPRNIMKMTNHFLLMSIKHYWNQFATTPTLIKVPAHTNDPRYKYNALADSLAKRATNSSLTHAPIDLNLPLEIAKQHSYTFLFHNNTLVEQYPAHYIKKKFRLAQRENNDKSLRKNIAITIDSQEPIDIRFTREIIKKAAPRMNPSQVKELKFRIQLYNRRIATGKLLHSWSLSNRETCPYCHQTEDIQHLWQCSNTRNHFSSLIQHLEKEYFCRYPKANVIHYQTICKLTQIHHPNFLFSSISKGILIKWYKNYIKDEWLNNNLDASELFQTLVQIIDCWLSLFYDHIWKPRCQKYFEPSNSDNLTVSISSTSNSDNLTVSISSSDIEKYTVSLDSTCSDSPNNIPIPSIVPPPPILDPPI
jgi:ribonuclease HI